jgi:hypothetical protein
VSGRVRLEETGCEQAADLQDGQRDHAWFGRRGLIRGDRGRGLGIGTVFQQGGGDRADRQGGHHQHGMAEDRGVERAWHWSRPTYTAISRTPSLTLRLTA